MRNRGRLFFKQIKSKKYEFQKAQCGFDDNPQHYNNSHFSPTMGKQIEKDEMYTLIVMEI